MAKGARHGEGGRCASKMSRRHQSVEEGLKESLTLHQRNGSPIMGPD